jgi:YdjC-like protein
MVSLFGEESLRGAGIEGPPVVSRQGSSELRNPMKRGDESIRTLLDNHFMAQETKPPVSTSHMGKWAGRDDEAMHSGALIVNADDWGRDRQTTDRTLECILRRAVSSVSAMVFMEDSERAAVIARTRGIDVGLHLNFTTRFGAPNVPARLAERQREIAGHLRRHRLAQVIFNPWLVRSFQYVLASQVDEFCRLYGAQPERFDGHHHMHLCANVLLGGLLPTGAVVRRNFSFRAGEKGMGNRCYRQTIDYLLARRHRVTDFFFSLAPIEPLSRLKRIFSLAGQYVVEVETHPINQEEYRFLAEGEIFHCVRHLPISTHSAE